MGFPLYESTLCSTEDASEKELDDLAVVLQIFASTVNSVVWNIKCAKDHKESGKRKPKVPKV